MIWDACDSLKAIISGSLSRSLLFLLRLLSLRCLRGDDNMGLAGKVLDETMG
jgi:hypothetical protein